MRITSRKKKKKKTVQPAVCVGVCLPCTTVDLLKVDETTTTIQKWERNKRGEWVNAKTWPKGENDWRSPAQLHPNGLHPYECDPISLVKVSFPFFFFFSLFYLISSKSTTMGRLVDQSGHYNRTVSVWCVSSFKAKRGKEGIGKGATNPSIQKARLIFLSAPTFHTHTHTSRPPSQSLALPAQPDRET